MDLISRQAAIEAVGYYCCHSGDKLLFADNALKQLPSAQQSHLERAVIGKSPEEIYDFLYWLMFDHARLYTDSRAAVIAWLKGESDG